MPLGLNNSNCHGRRSCHGRALRLYLIYILLPDPLCVDGMDGENIPDEEIAAAAVTVAANMIEYWSTASGIAVVWSG